MLLTLVLRREWLDTLARVAGVYYPPSALFLILVFFMMLILIHYSTVISQLLSNKQILVQEVGVLDARTRELESLTGRDFEEKIREANR